MNRNILNLMLYWIDKRKFSFLDWITHISASGMKIDVFATGEQEWKCYSFVPQNDIYVAFTQVKNIFVSVQYSTLEVVLWAAVFAEYRYRYTL